VVYMAEQTEPVERRVALKIIKPGMDTRQVIGRFEAERHALAMMDHPNIARVLDAGTTGERETRDQGSGARERLGDPSSLAPDPGPPAPDLSPLAPAGRPYFVMELVKGVPITQYCDEHHLTPQQRLELFVPVCRAVQHAHQKGIIHRDIKPTNVLVAEYDDRPVPKIIDFGVAKAIQQPLSERTVFTQLGQVVGTIDYMSPEQAKLNEFDVDTRTDVYSLGVLLYELLTGETPLDRERLRAAAFDELLRIIREEEPPKPSHRLSSSHSLPLIAANRQTEPRKLSTLVRGELDWIVMKALEKDRARRYETANALAADVAHYLADEPVVACPPSAAYRFKKFARRNKGLLATAALILAVLLAAAVVSTSQAIRATKAERAAAERLVAEQGALLEKSRHLWRSYVNEAAALRRTRRAGHRFESLDRLRKAAGMLAELRLPEASTLELRNEWIACSALPVDVRPGEEVLTGAAVLEVDAGLQYCLCRDAQGAVHLHRFADGKKVDWLAAHEDFALAGWASKFSPNGRFLAARSRSDFYRIWDLDERRIIKDIPMASGMYAVAFTPDSRAVAYGHEDKRIYLVDLTTGAQLGALPAGPALPRRLCFSPDGRRLAVVFDGIREVHIRDAQTGETNALEHPAPIALASWSFDGRLLAVSCDDFNIYVWDTGTWQPRAILRGHQWGGVVVAFWPQSYRLFSGSWDGTRRLWDASTGLELLQMSSVGWIVGFSPDERQIVCQAPQGARLCEVSTSQTCRLLSISAHGYAQRYSVAFHPGGRLLACASGMGVHFWDLAGDHETAVLPIVACGGAVIHPIDGSLITSGSRGLHRWPLEADATGQGVHLGPSEPLATTITHSTHRLCLSPDGRFLAAQSGAGVIWCDLQTGQAKVSSFAPDLTGFVSISPDGRWVGTGAGDGFMLWDTQSDQDAATNLWPEAQLFWAVFDATGQWLCASTREACRIYQVGTWDIVHRIAGNDRAAGEETHFGPAAFTPDSRMLAVRCALGSVRLLDTATWAELATLEPFEPRTIVALAFSPDGSLLAVTTLNHGVQLWDLRQIRRELGPLGLDWDMAPYPPPSWDASDEPLQITGLPESTGELTCFQKHAWTIWRVAFAPDDRTALSLGGPDVLLWEVPSGKVLHRFSEYGDSKEKGARCGSFFPGGTRGDRIVVGGHDGAVRVLDFRTGQQVKRFQAPGPVTDLAVSPDGRRILMGTSDGTAIVWDPQEDREESRHQLHSQAIRRLAISPDGSRALTASYDDVVCYWDLQTGRVLHRFTAPDSSVAFSPDGRHALICDAADLLLVDLESGREVRLLRGHTGEISAVAFGPDGRRAVSGGDDRTVRAWDVETGEQLARFTGHRAPITDVAISHDGQFALSGSLYSDPTVRLWRLPDVTEGPPAPSIDRKEPP
jgi:WD40 repeat protein/serine/threonine protein kinase